jgi:hypothetical protein
LMTSARLLLQQLQHATIISPFHILRHLQVIYSHVSSSSSFSPVHTLSRAQYLPRSFRCFFLFFSLCLTPAGSPHFTSPSPSSTLHGRHGPASPVPRRLRRPAPPRPPAAAADRGAATLRSTVRGDGGRAPPPSSLLPPSVAMADPTQPADACRGGVCSLSPPRRSTRDMAAALPSSAARPIPRGRRGGAGRDTTTTGCGAAMELAA